MPIKIPSSSFPILPTPHHNLSKTIKFYLWQEIVLELTAPYLPWLPSYLDSEYCSDSSNDIDSGFWHPDQSGKECCSTLSPKNLFPTAQLVF